MKTVFGEEGLDRLLRLRNTELEKTYRARTDKAATLKARLMRWRGTRRRRLYGRGARDGQSGDRTFTKSTARSALPHACAPGFAAEELKLFQRVLGESVKIERISYILEGQAAAPIASRR